MALREVESVPFAVEIETFPPTVRIALVDVAVRVDAFVPPIVRSLVIVNEFVTVSDIGLKVPEIVRDFIVVDVERAGSRGTSLSPMMTSVTEVGTPFVQFEALVQRVLTAPVHDVVVCVKRNCAQKIVTEKICKGKRNKNSKQLS
jgi:hypothetical protein